MNNPHPLPSPLPKHRSPLSLSLSLFLSLLFLSISFSLSLSFSFSFFLSLSRSLYSLSYPFAHLSLTPLLTHTLSLSFTLLLLLSPPSSTPQTTLQLKWTVVFGRCLTRHVYRFSPLTRLNDANSIDFKPRSPLFHRGFDTSERGLSVHLMFYSPFLGFLGFLGPCFGVGSFGTKVWDKSFNAVLQ